MKRFSWMLLLLLPLCSFSQKITVKHTYYTTTFDQKKHIPYVVKYTLTNKMLSCSKKIARTNNFSPDPRLPQTTRLEKDYAAFGYKYDRGHNMSAEDNECSETGMKECFYFSNIYPQTAKLNRGVWKQLEVKERLKAHDLGSVEVFIGSYGAADTIGTDGVIVPAWCWKVFYANGTYEAYTFPNTTTVEGPINGFKTTISEIESKSGYRFSE